VSLTDVTDTALNPQQADIVVHYVPHAGGVVWGGIALCGDHRCNNVIVRSDVPDLIDVGVPNYDPERVFRVALHELGHALGLGHAEPLNETNDLMGYVVEARRGGGRRRTDNHVARDVRRGRTVEGLRRRRDPWCTRSRPRAWSNVSVTRPPWPAST
jgi:hypothetical protein